MFTRVARKTKEGLTWRRSLVQFQYRPPFCFIGRCHLRLFVNAFRQYGRDRSLDVLKMTPAEMWSSEEKLLWQGFWRLPQFLWPADKKKGHAAACPYLQNLSAEAKAEADHRRKRIRVRREVRGSRLLRGRVSGSQLERRRD